jgi:hypothetical protein
MLWQFDCDLGRGGRGQAQEERSAVRVSKSLVVATTHLGYHTAGSAYSHGATSLFGAVGVRGLELEGDGGPLLTELFLLRGSEELDAKGGRVLPCMELVSESCLLICFFKPVYSSPKNPCSFLWNLPLELDLEPVDDTVVALAIDGRRSSPSGNDIPLPGAKPGDICPRFSEESL